MVRSRHGMVVAIAVLAIAAARGPATSPSLSWGALSGACSPRSNTVRSMIGRTEPGSGLQAEGLNAARNERIVRLAMLVGVGLALVGLVDGFVMALKRHVAPCPNGTYFPRGATDFNCYVHPNAGPGIAIAAFSALLGILVVLSAISATASLRSGPTSRGV